MVRSDSGEPRSLAVEFVMDGPPAVAAPRSDPRWRLWILLAAGLVIFGGVRLVGDQHAVTGHGHSAIRATSYTPVRYAPGESYLASWHYGYPIGPIYGHGADPDYLEVARGAGQQLQVITMGSRGCPTLVTAIHVLSPSRVVVDEGQPGPQTGCYLAIAPITNVLAVPTLDLARPVTVQTGRTSVTVPPG